VERDKDPQADRARRLNEAIKRGPQPARSPHEFVQEKMRTERRKGEAAAPARSRTRKKEGDR
jgi:hypothetical protein